MSAAPKRRPLASGHVVEPVELLRQLYGAADSPTPRPPHIVLADAEAARLRLEAHPGAGKSAAPHASATP